MICFEIVCIVMIAINYYINRRMINVISIFAIPYMIVIPVNNLLMTRYGFFEISNKVIIMILVGLVCIFMGSIVADIRKRVSKTKVIVDYEQNNCKFDYYKLKKMLRYTFCVEFIVVLKFFYIVFSKGIGYLSTSAYEGELIHGILGHVFLTIYPLVPILFYYWLKNKAEKKYLIATIVCIVLLFFTFVKYHVIGMIVLIYLFCALEDHKYLKKGAVVVLSLVAFAFVFNYFSVFLIRGTTSLISKNYYFNHLWNYIAGSLIYDNQIFVDGVRNNISIGYKIGTFLSAPINLFINALWGVKIFPHEAQRFLSMGNNAEKGNVVDAIGYLYPSKGSAIEILLWICILFLVGLLFTLIYNREIKKKRRFSIKLCVFMTFWMFFSFFGTFYVSFTPWEILLWSVIMPNLFDKRVKFK